VTNQFTAGTVKIEINEHGFTDVVNWNPGDTTEKKVSVKSKGSKASYVRVSLTPVWEDNLPIDNVILNWNENDWVYSGGWYYYKQILGAGQETPLLLQSVTLDGSGTGDQYQGKALQIVVDAEAVQASHGAYKDAWGLISCRLAWRSGSLRNCCRPVGVGNDEVNTGRVRLGPALIKILTTP